MRLNRCDRSRFTKLQGVQFMIQDYFGFYITLLNLPTKVRAHLHMHALINLIKFVYLRSRRRFLLEHSTPNNKRHDVNYIMKMALAMQVMY